MGSLSSMAPSTSTCEETGSVPASQLPVLQVCRLLARGIGMPHAGAIWPRGCDDRLWHTISRHRRSCPPLSTLQEVLGRFTLRSEEVSEASSPSIVEGLLEEQRVLKLE